MPRRNILKVLFFLIFCLLFCLNIFGQVDANQTESEILVKEFYLARDDGHGKAGEGAEKFFTNDVPIYCVVQLNSMKSATVKMNLIAVKVPGVKPESKVFTVSYKTNGKQSRVNFTGQPEGGTWIAGTYRIDIFIDEKPANTQIFEIQKRQKEIEADARPKAKTPNKAVRKFRKT